MNYYIYYKLDAQAVPVARSRINELFEKIQKQFGVQGRWMRRRDDPATYMEVYEGVKDEAGFEAVMEAEGPRIAPNRRLERFVSA